MSAPVIWFGNAVKFLKSQLNIPGSTSGNLTLQPSAVTTSHTLTFPAAQGTAQTQMQNDGAGALTWSNTSGLTTTPNFLFGDDRNFNGSIGSWLGYDDGAVSVPLNLTGGAPSVISIARGTAFNSTGNARITHTAADGQGEGVSLLFSVEPEYFSSVMDLEFDFQTSSGYADDKLELWIYNVTDSVLIQPVPYQLKASLTPSKFKAQFQTSATGASYRVGFFCGNTTATAYTIDLKNIRIGPSVYNYGLVGTDWTAWVPTGSFTNTTYSGFYKRIGGDLHGRVKCLLTGTPGAADLTVTLPAGFVIDTDRISTFSQRGMAIGTASLQDVGTKSWGGLVFYNSTTSVSVTDAAAGGDVGATVPFTFANTDVIGIDFIVPIVGWSSNVQLSDSADLRIVAATYGITTGASTTSANPINFETKVFDTHSAVITGAGTWKFTAPSSGYYRVGGTSLLSAAVNFILKKNGTGYAYLGTIGSAVISAIAPVTIQLNAGDYIQLFPDGTTTPQNIAAGVYQCIVSIEKVQGPSAIAATELIACSYNTATAQVFEAAGGGEIANFDTKGTGATADTHSSVQTGAAWAFTCPVAGRYAVSCSLSFGSVAWTAGNFIEYYLYKNGANVRTMFSIVQPVTFTANTLYKGDAEADFLAGDTIAVHVDHNCSGGNISLQANAVQNWIEIHRVK